VVFVAEKQDIFPDMKKAWRTYNIFISLGVVLALIVWIVNYVLYGFWIPILSIAAILLLIGSYFLIVYLGLLMLFVGAGIWKRLMGLLILAVIGLSLFNVTYWAIYKIYPQLGIQLYLPDVPFVEEYFRSRILSNFSFIFILALLAALFRLYQLRVRRLNELSYQLEQMKLQFSSAQIYPHFVESVTVTALGQSLLNSSPGGRKCLEQLAGVMRYVLNAQRNADHLISLEEEWKQVCRLAEVAQWKYGKSKVKLEINEMIPIDQWTISVGLLTLFENALKYASFCDEGNISISLIVGQEGFQFTSTNAVDPLKQVSLEGSGFGLQYLRTRIEQSGLPIKLEVSQDSKIYNARFIQKFE